MEGGGNILLAGIVGFAPIIVKGISVLIEFIANKIKKRNRGGQGKVQEEMENQINELQIQKKTICRTSRKNEERIQDLEQN